MASWSRGALKTKSNKNPTAFSWLRRAHVKSLAAALGQGNCRFVGGAVRDSLLGRPVRDIDAATPLKPEEVQKRVEDSGGKVALTGLKHGTITAIYKGKPIEVTTLRRDVKTYGRHADVVFDAEWEDDAARRDFTVNALYVDPHGMIYDYFTGFEDLEERVIRFIGKARDRIREDGLRILRFYRLQAELEFRDAGGEGRDACRLDKELISSLSVERVRDELFKILAVPNPEPILNAMATDGVFAKLMPGLADLVGLKSLIAAEADAVGGHALRRFLALSRGGRTPITELAQNMKLTKKQQKHLAELDDLLRTVKAPHNSIAARKLAYRKGRDVVRDGLYFWHINNNRLPLAKMVAALAEFDVGDLPIGGRDLIDLGYEPGEYMGAYLQQLENQWIGSDFSLDQEALLDMARQAME